MSSSVRPPEWSEDQFSEAVTQAIREFRDRRMHEPLEEYSEQFDHYRSVVEDLLEGTVDLTLLRDEAVEYVTNEDLLTAIRYLSSPAVSADDLKVISEADSLAPGRLSADPEMSRRVVETVLLGLDRNRFPWVAEDREPTEAERLTAVIATTALIATQKQQTARRHSAKNEQENKVAQYLLAHGYTEVPTRVISSLADMPKPGEFCHESLFGSRKADLVIGLWDGRSMPTECKVSNSSTNSVKRLNNDAAVKAKTWISEFGTRSVVPAAVLAGVFKVHNLKTAQEDGLTIWWSQDLDMMMEFINKTKP